MLTQHEIESGYQRVQSDFVAALQAVDQGAEFVADHWEREAGGGGVSMVASDAPVIEKAAVNFSSVHGDTPPQLSDRLAVESSTFSATGVSIIVHPRNPHVPTFHANVRYFQTDVGPSWFGGGADLTPHYLYPDDAVDFHMGLAAVCGRHRVADYPAWKVDCDRYFHLPHRDEARGVGGVFFDHLRNDPDEVWTFQLDLMSELTALYPRILARRMDTPSNQHQRNWQLYRRGRYVEFNLVWDRGTRFGLETRGRTESILASLPPLVRFDYDHHPAPGSPEADLLDMLTGPPRQWVPDSLLSSPATSMHHRHE